MARSRGKTRSGKGSSQLQRFSHDRLLKGTTILEPQGILLEDELDFDDGEGVLLETGSSVLLDGESKQTYNITMEEGTIPNSKAAVLRI